MFMDLVMNWDYLVMLGVKFFIIVVSSVYYKLFESFDTFR